MWWISVILEIIRKVENFALGRVVRWREMAYETERLELNGRIC